MNKQVKWAIVGLVMGVLMIGATGCQLSSAVGGTKVDQQKSFDGKGVQNISIRTSSARVHLNETTDDRISISLNGSYSNGNATDANRILTTSVRGSDLNVQVEVPDHLLWNHVDLDVNVLVPKKVYDQIKVETSSGLVDLDSFESKSLALTTSSGDIQLAGYKGDQLQAQSSSGDIEMGTIATKKLTVSASSGNVKVAGNTGGSYDISTSSGDIELNQMSGDGKLKASSGDLKVSLTDITHLLDIETSSGDANVYVPEKAAFRLDAQVKQSNLKINLPVTVQIQQDRHFAGDVNYARADAPVLHVKMSSGAFELGKVAN